jgi:hypothetical protein
MEKAKSDPRVSKALQAQLAQAWESGFDSVVTPTESETTGVKGLD